eukprot:3165018-Ditylum_brightwellii.AAC.1
MAFDRTKGDPDNGIRNKGSSYEYIDTHMYDIIIVSKDAQSMFRELKNEYQFKSTTAPEYHLGVNYISILVSKGETMFILGSTTCILEAL